MCGGVCGRLEAREEFGEDGFRDEIGGDGFAYRGGRLLVASRSGLNSIRVRSVKTQKRSGVQDRYLVQTNLHTLYAPLQTSFARVNQTTDVPTLVKPKTSLNKIILHNNSN